MVYNWLYYLYTLNLTKQRMWANKVEKDIMINCLVDLYLGSNQIKVIENIPESVIDLYLGSNQIKVIENIPEDVIYLDLGSNQIKVIENIPESVIDLFLGDNQIRVIPPDPKYSQIVYNFDELVGSIEHRNIRNKLRIRTIQSLMHERYISKIIYSYC